MNKVCVLCNENPPIANGQLCTKCLNNSLAGDPQGDWSRPSQELISTAQEIIDKYHPNLAGCRIGFLFRMEAPRSKGKQVWGAAIKVIDRIKAVVSLDFIIWIAYDIWNSLPSKQRSALIDHQLCHCDYNEIDRKASTRHHDIEEFTAVIERHGYWNLSLFEMARKAPKQLELDLVVESTPGTAVSIDPGIFHPNGVPND